MDEGVEVEVEVGRGGREGAEAARSEDVDVRDSWRA